MSCEVGGGAGLVWWGNIWHCDFMDVQKLSAVCQCHEGNTFKNKTKQNFALPHEINDH